MDEEKKSRVVFYETIITGEAMIPNSIIGKGTDAIYKYADENGIKLDGGEVLEAYPRVTAEIDAQN